MSTLMIGMLGCAFSVALVAVCSGVTRFAHWLSLRRGLSAGGPGWPLTRPWL